MSDQLAIFIDFENVALWAEREFFDFEITKLIESLQSRGPVVIKRAFADWSRFSRYRDELMNNSIDLIQIYSIRSGKNRADIRMAIDAFEIALTRPQIHTFVIVSGDSDFSSLAVKLREYGHYIIGIGPRSITHDLLVRSCDEFIYLETALGELTTVEDQSCLDIENARNLLSKALVVHGQRGNIPVLAPELKQTMLLMDPAFSEANFGYAQFKHWLEENQDLARLYVKDLQLYVAPVDYINSEYLEVLEKEVGDSITEISRNDKQKILSRAGLSDRYKQVFSRMKITAIDLSTRRDMMRDIYQELGDNSTEYTSESLLESLFERYQKQNLKRDKSTLREILQSALRQGALEPSDQPNNTTTPIRLAQGIESEAKFIGRIESDFLYAVVSSGFDIDQHELAYILFSDPNQADYIQNLLDDLKKRGMIQQKAKRYCLTGKTNKDFKDNPVLQVLIQDIKQVEIPADIIPSSETAQILAKKAMIQRSQDFAASTNTYLVACRLQWDAVEKGEPGATLEDLRWFLASYASSAAGKLSQVDRDYPSARPYYLAFFSLVQEDDPLWSRMRGLINPMLAYYWSNTGRELDINVSTWNPYMSSPAQIAVNAATHPDSELRQLWLMSTIELAQINPGILRRIENQLTLSRAETPENGRVADQIEEILSQVSQT